MRRRKRPRSRKCKIQLPSLFLNGGTFYDPLNLAIFQDEETNRRLNAVTPRSSPLQTPRSRNESIEVPDIDPADPLGLFNGGSKKKKKRKRKAAPPVGGPNAKVAKLTAEMPPPESSGGRRALSKRSQKRKSEMDQLSFYQFVSPAVPQPGTGRRERKRKITAATIAAAKKHPSDYRYGNYDRYYFFRDSIYGPGDPRLTIKLLRPKMFQGKDVLDIGCNSGELTIALALFGAKSVVGVEIDVDLINRAKKNQRQFLKGERCIVLEESKELELRASNPTLKNLIFVSLYFKKGMKRGLVKGGLSSCLPDELRGTRTQELTKETRDKSPKRILNKYTACEQRLGE
ncbi:Hypothetical predicted protein [Cloeon dipterum]|uniref:RNA methyltransferase n=1 Tax=Cloeon dipterum TaxID=197152 RepID=A0A8S1E878_9INSE|nr:Hypothetical predicted protein [Cloeon dipterum]